jgi:putative tryptophan/tyrosine transport system substrate-binding protein
VLMNYAATDPEGIARLAAFTSTLQERGWTDGGNLRMDVRWFEGNVERARAYATELIALAPEAIVVASNPALTELQRLNRTIPMVFTQVSDPVEGGFVGGLARPAGITTGFQNFEPDIGGKWLGILKEAVPHMSRAALLMEPNASSHAAFLRAAEAVAPSLGVQVTPAPYRDGNAIEQTIGAFAGHANVGLIVAPHPIPVARRHEVIALATRHRVPTVYPFRFFATEGGLMSYGLNQLEQWRGAAGYVDRILHGEKPADLPVQAPTKYELVINLGTAKALGLDIPAKVLALADDVIE